MAASLTCLRHNGVTQYGPKMCRFLHKPPMTTVNRLARQKSRLMSICSAQIDDREMVFDSKTLALLADGSAVVKFGDSSVLATAVSSRKFVDSDFVHLKVDYREKAAAMGYIPTNYKRKDLAPSEKEILSGRLVDRSVRSLFPKGYYNETQIICNLLAADGVNNPDVLSINAASAALHISDIPWNGPVGAVRVGDVDNQFVMNPTRKQLEQSSLNLVLASTGNKIVMLEGGAKEVSSERILEALKRGHAECQEIINAIEKLRDQFGKEKREYIVAELPEKLTKCVKELSEGKIRQIFLDSSLTKLPRDEALRKVQNEVRESIKNHFPDVENQTFVAAFNQIVRGVFRSNVLNGLDRCDGRSLDAIRPISCDVDLYTPLHGSAVFKRGETQVFCTITFDAVMSSLGRNKSPQSTSSEITKHFFLHYEFPPFSNNEIGLPGGNSRREIGHGALAEKALAPVVPAGFPFTVRLTSEVMMSNGSSSMASVCGGSMALMDAGVPISGAVAGVACGLVTSSDQTNGEITEYKLITDILGIEDYLGDMDFKLAGTRHGITALQADFKIPGLPLNIVEEAIHKATDDRMKVLDIMDSVISEPREEVKDNGPVTDTVSVPSRKRAQFVGPGGMNLRKLENETGVSLNMVNEEKWSIFAPSPTAMQEAQTIIEELLKDKPEPDSLLQHGGIYEGQIVELKPFGVMVELMPGVPPALLHNAQLDHRKIFSHEVLGLKVGQPIRVKYFGRDPVTGRMRISRKAILPAPQRDEYKRELETVYNKTVLDSVRKTMRVRHKNEMRSNDE